jgi:hypothetical protein
VRFARHLAAVLLLVGVIIAVGVAWAHGSPPGASHSAPVPVGTSPKALRPDGPLIIRDRPGRGPGLTLSHLGNLVRTMIIEAVIAAVIVAVSAARRQRRRARRAAS